MHQLLDLGRENAALQQELTRLSEELSALRRFLIAGARKGKEHVMPRIIQLAPDGGGRYIAVDRDGDLWRGEAKRPKEGVAEYIQWTPLRSQFPEDNR